VYIGTKRGLYRASADGRQVQRVQIGQREPTASTWALLADGQTLWIGGQSDGLWQLDLASGRGGPVALQPALTDQRITVLARGQGDTLWVGTRYGLNQVDAVQRRVRAGIVPTPQHPEGLNAGFIDTLYTDRQGRLWVGTYGGGINILESGDATPPRFRHLGTQQGLPDDNVNALLEDGSGQVWASTDNGMAVIDPQSLSLRALRRAEGVVFNTYWTGSAARTPSGELLFGGAGGLSIVRPERLQPWNYRPPVVVSELRVAGRVVNAGAHVGGAQATPVQVPADGNSLSVEFAAIDYSAPERNRYAYRLLGFERDWVETDAARRLAAYNNLPPGNYTLQLRGSNRDGAWTEALTTLAVQVQPAWHQTFWFRSAAALALLLALLLVVRWRTGLLRRQQAELEHKVQERTAELHAVSKALREKSRVLELSSVTDPLTGLHNRRFLTSHIDTEIAASLRRATEPLSASGPAAVDTDNVFLLIDVDHFKRVNDLHGHAAGDHVLVQFGQRLRGLMRETDFLVRWGGEEFLAVARNTDRARAEELAERIRAVVAQSPFTLDDGRTLNVSCSVGFASVPFVREQPRALGWQDVVQVADLALMAAKRAGRDTWVGLLAGDAVQSDGLLARLQMAPRLALQSGALRVVSNRARDVVTEALCAATVPAAAD
ncbi:MAG: diguanylate cyclase, partial [Rubrivivax sp.]